MPFTSGGWDKVPRGFVVSAKRPGSAPGSGVVDRFEDLPEMGAPGQVIVTRVDPPHVGWSWDGAQWIQVERSC